MKELFLYEWEWKHLPANIDADGLREYLAKVWATRNYLFENEEATVENEEEVSDIKRYKQGFLRFDDCWIGAKNYVGFIQFNGVAINIFPKIFSEICPNPENNTGSITSNLLHWLSYSNRIKFPFSEVSFEEQKFDNFLEPFIFIFSEFSNRLIESLPYQRFEEVTEQTTFLKGRLAINDYLSQSVVKGNYHRLYSTYDTFQFNNKFNQIIKHVSKLLLSNTENPHSIHRLQNILFLLDEVDDVICSVTDCDTIFFNKMYGEWDKILNMGRMFLANHSFKTQTFNKPNFCFLVPMEQVYEEFIAGLLSKYGICDTKSQSTQKWLTNENRFQIRPDIIYNGKIIIDTKYKIISRASEDNYSISQGDLYQMLAYAVRFKITSVILLYPNQSGEDESICYEIAKYTINDSFSNIDVTIKIVLVDIKRYNDFGVHNTLDLRLVSELEGI